MCLWWSCSIAILNKQRVFGWVWLTRNQIDIWKSEFKGRNIWKKWPQRNWMETKLKPPLNWNISSLHLPWGRLVFGRVLCKHAPITSICPIFRHKTPIRQPTPGTSTVQQFNLIKQYHQIYLLLARINWLAPFYVIFPILAGETPLSWTPASWDPDGPWPG